MTIEGARRRKPKQAEIDVDALSADLKLPRINPLTRPYDLMVTGVGGTGVVTVGALVSMAAHLEGKGSSVLDFTGFAQKYGSVISYIRLAQSPDSVHQARIDAGQADAVIGCDVVVSSSPKASSCYANATRIIVNTAAMPTGDIVLRRDASLEVDHRVDLIQQVIANGNLETMDANGLSEKLMSDTVFANVMMLGAAWQSGMVPVSLDAVLRAIELNNVAVDQNKKAFMLGRVWRANPSALGTHIATPSPEPVSVTELISRHERFLTDYQDLRWAARYRQTIGQLSPTFSDQLLETAAKSLFKLMSYK